mgnify:CR=1 FL=1
MLINLLTQSIRKKKHFLIVPSSNDNINTIQNLLFKNIITCFSKLQNKKGSFFIIFLNCSKNFQPNIGYVSGNSKKTTSPLFALIGISCRSFRRNNSSTAAL